MLYVIPNCICSVYVIYLCPINVLILSDLSRVFLPRIGLAFCCCCCCSFLKTWTTSPKLQIQMPLEARQVMLPVPPKGAVTAQLQLIGVLKDRRPQSYMLMFPKKLTKFRFPFTEQLKYDCGPHRPRSCHLFFVRACVPSILSKCQTLGAQVYLWILRPSTFPPRLNFPRFGLPSSLLWVSFNNSSSNKAQWPC